MSTHVDSTATAALRRALELVDGQSPRKSGRRVARNHNKLPYQRRELTTCTLSQSTVDKLLRLSSTKRPVQDADKIVERAIKGKPLQDKPEQSSEDTGSILFPEQEKSSKSKKTDAE